MVGQIREIKSQREQEFIQVPDRDLTPQEASSIIERCKDRVTHGMVSLLWGDLHYFGSGQRRQQPYPITDNYRVWESKPVLTESGLQSPENTARVSLFLPTDAEEKIVRAPRIDFTFHMRPEALKDLPNPTDRFVCESISLNKKTDYKNEVAIDLLGEKDTSPLEINIVVSGKVLKETLTQFLEYQDTDNSETEETVKALAVAYGLNKQKTETLLRAIAAYKLNHTESLYRNSRIGDCLTVPKEFRRFSKKEYGLDIANCHYGEQMEDGEYNSYHEVNVISKEDVVPKPTNEHTHLQDGIAIDWTAPQFSDYREYTRDTIPYPLIYRVKDDVDNNRAPLWFGF
jgi:hypothetical protein